MWYDIIRGDLTVHLHEARGLPAVDRGGTSDPYVRIEVHGTRHRSKTVKTSLEPAFDESLKWQSIGSSITGNSPCHPKNPNDPDTPNNHKNPQ